jgi:hypothetical protein
MMFGISALSQQTQVIEYGYNARGELNMIIQDMDTLISFYDASGNRITESQNIYSVNDPVDPKGDHFLTCYPNPTGDEITIAFELAGEMDYNLSLYNQVGQFQKEIASEQNAAGNKEIRISLAGFSNGVYYIWFRSNNISKVKKIIRIE